MFAFIIAHLPAFCQKSDSSRIAVFYRAGRDITIPEYKAEAPLTSIGEAVEKGFSQTDFVQLHLGLVYQMRNRWGLGLVYSNFLSPEIPVNSSAYFKAQYPGYAVVNPPGAGKLNLGSDFLSLHLEHSFQKKFLFVCPYAEAGIGRIKEPEIQAFMKQPDANRYLSVGVSYSSGLSSSYTCGVDLGVRFIKDLFFFCFSPSVGYYRWQWTQTDYSTDFFGQTTRSEQQFSLRQTHFLLMVNMGIRIPFSSQFYKTL